MAAQKRNHTRGYDFPNEGFVQSAIEKHFSSLGFHNNTEGHADLICFHPTTNERWVVEAKGLTTDIGLDFRTGLGQLIQRMVDQSSYYAIAVPDIPQFIKQCILVQPWVRKKLGLHWIFIKEDGTVTTCPPDESISEYVTTR